MCLRAVVLFIGPRKTQNPRLKIKVSKVWLFTKMNRTYNIFEN